MGNHNSSGDKPKRRGLTTIKSLNAQPTSAQISAAGVEMGQQYKIFWTTGLVFFFFVIYFELFRPENSPDIFFFGGWIVMLFCIGRSITWFSRAPNNNYRMRAIALMLFLSTNFFLPGKVAYALREWELQNGKDIEAQQVFCEKGDTAGKRHVQLYNFRLSYSVAGKTYEKYFSNLGACPGRDQPVFARIGLHFPEVIAIDWKKTKG